MGNNVVKSYRFTLDGTEIECLACSFSQVRSEAMIITISTRIPEGGITLSGEGVLFVSFEDGTEVQVGKGLVSGFPIGLAGDEVSFDIICKTEDGFEEMIDLAYDELPAFWQPEPEVVPLGNRRRAEGYVPFFVNVDPNSHEISFISINGNNNVPHVMNGEGSASGTSFLLSASPSMNADPIKELVVETVANWQQVEAKVIDFGPEAIGTIQTATPDEYVAAVDNVTLQGGGSYLFVGSTLKPSFNSSTEFPVAVRKSYVDARTSILHPTLYQNLTVNRYLAPDVDVLTTVTQMRNERCRFVFTMDHGVFGGRRITETYSLSEPEERFRGETVHPIAGGGRGFGRVTTYPDSVSFLAQDDDDFRSLYIPQAIINRSWTQIIDASYCVTLRIETTADEVMKMKIGDRCVINDTRLPAGRAEGRVALISVVIDSNATGVFELECSTCVDSSYTLSVPTPETLSVVNPDEATPPATDAVSALRSSNQEFFLEPGVEHTNGRWDAYEDEGDPVLGLLSQRTVIEEINATNVGGIAPIIDPTSQEVPEINDIRGRVREFLPVTTLAIKLRDVGESRVVAEGEHIVEVQPVKISVKKGVS